MSENKAVTFGVLEEEGPASPDFWDPRGKGGSAQDVRLPCGCWYPEAAEDCPGF